MIGHDSSTTMAHKTLGACIGKWDTDDTVLTTDQIPSHRHDFENSGRPLYWDSGLTVMGGLAGGNTVECTWGARTAYTGGGHGHHHMHVPPSLVVKMWKRTA